MAEQEGTEVEPALETSPRRDLLMKLAGLAAGGLAVKALAGCTNEDSPPDIGTTDLALFGTATVW